MKALELIKRPVFICFLTSAILFSLAACGNSDDEDEPEVNDAALLIGKWYQSATWSERGGYKEETIDRNNWYITLTFEKNGIATTEIREYDEYEKNALTYTYDSKNKVICFVTSNSQKIEAKVLELKATSLILENQNKRVYYIK